MKRFLKKACLLLLLFCLVLGGAITYNWYRNRETVSYTTLQKASLPVVSLTYKEGCTNRFFGYLDDMEYRTMRPAITPLSDRRRLTVSIDCYGNAIDQVIYQLRSTDGERLVEDGILDKWRKNEDTMSQELQLANLMEDGREYILVLMLKQKERTIRYYSRVVYMEENHTDELLQFVQDFSEATFSGNQELIVNYIQPNDTMGTDDLSCINIHSRYRMFIWNELHPTITGGTETEISELSDSQMTVTLHYPVSITADGITKQCDVEERFVVRYRNDTRYLLDYERLMTERFSFSAMQFNNGNICLGVTSDKSDTMLSPDQKIQAFVYQGQLWSYDSGKETMSLIFTYRDGTDERSGLNRHSIRLVRVSDNGDVDFIVYGYHNRGLHEGHVGVCFYRYVSEENRMEEQFYIQSSVSEEILCTGMGGLAYVSDTDLLYFLYGNTMYSIDLTSREKMELATQDSSDGFYSNDAASAAAWHEGEPGRTEQIVVMNLENGQLFRISAQEGEFLQIQGFIGTDIIYGVGRISDSGLLSGMKEIMPMYKLCFASAGETLEESGVYEQAGVYIIGTSIDENEVRISRVSKNGTFYEPAADDQVFLNDRKETNTSGMVKSSQNGSFLKESYISLNVAVDDLTFQTDPCRYEEQMSETILTAADGLENTSGYYVYGRGRLLSVKANLAEAITAAYDVMGCVMDGSRNYLWTRGTRAITKNLTLEQAVCESETMSLETSLNMLISFEGAADPGISTMLQEGQSVFSVLSAALRDQALDLTGCKVSQILYYLNQGHPVLAQTGDRSAELITGYETGSITVYSPYNGEIRQMPMEEAETYFGELGNRFFSCR